jgi:cysteine desulfurase/selenocysteine lyase
MNQTIEAKPNTVAGFDVERIRQDFPMLQKPLDGKPFIYLDSAASGQKPQAFIDRLSDFYSKEYGKPNEGHTASQRATQAEERTRELTAKYLNARDPKEIIFVRGTTEGINLVAIAFERAFLAKDDEVLITLMEHHSNIVPWQMACQNTGAKLKVAPITPEGVLDLNAFEQFLSDRTRIVSLLHSSQVLGTINPIKEITRLAHQRGIPVFVDGAQTAPHMPVDVQDLDCDFYAFSAHKMGGPAGIGVLYGKEEWLDKMPPHHGGTDMATTVTFEKTTYAPLPKKFEAGTSAFADIIAFGSLLEYLNGIGMDKIEEYELQLLAYAQERIGRIPRVKILGSAPEKEPLVSVTIEGVDVKKAEQYLAERGIAVRTGDLSAQPLMKHLGVDGALRASFAWYNTEAEIDQLGEALESYIREQG